MKKYEVTIRGVTPYLQHRMDDQKLEDWEKNRKCIVERDDVSKEDQVRAEFHAYSFDGGFFMPSEHVRGCLINAGGMVKSKVGNSRKSMKNIVAGMFFVGPERIVLPAFSCVDKRSCVNKNVKARVIVIRPRWDDWEVSFVLSVDNDTITDETVLEILENGGKFIGLGSFRPTSNGMFGRFEVVRCDRVKDKKK